MEQKQKMTPKVWWQEHMIKVCIFIRMCHIVEISS